MVVLGLVVEGMLVEEAEDVVVITVVSDVPGQRRRVLPWTYGWKGQITHNMQPY